MALSELCLKVIAALRNTATSNPGSLILMDKLVDTLFPRCNDIDDGRQSRLQMLRTHVFLILRTYMYRMRAGE